MDILIVEDDISARLLLSTYLTKWGHRVIEANDGEQAWQYLQKKPIHLVISDWLMPNLDGLGLCRRIRSANFSHYVYIILLTAKNGRDEITQGMESGADDFITKPFNAGELRARIRAGERIINLEKHLEDRNRKLSKANAVIRKDLEAAAELQKTFLPNLSHSVSGLNFESLFLPCAFVAGDIFNFFKLNGHLVGFYQLDVAGHGIPAAMLSVTVSKLLAAPTLHFDRVRSSREFESVFAPAKRISELNKQFHSDDDSMRHFTMLYGIIDTRANRIRISQAGHPAPILMRRDAVAPLPLPGGFPVGLMLNMEYEQFEFDFCPGDRLIVYSDGVIEFRNQNDEQFSLKRLLRRLHRLKGQPLSEMLQRLKHSLHTWRGANEFADDISILAIERTA